MIISSCTMPIILTGVLCIYLNFFEFIVIEIDFSPKIKNSHLGAILNFNNYKAHFKECHFLSQVRALVKTLAAVWSIFAAGVPFKDFMHLYMMQHNFRIDIEKIIFHQKPTLRYLETFYILMIKVCLIECPYTFSWFFFNFNEKNRMKFALTLKGFFSIIYLYLKIKWL